MKKKSLYQNILEMIYAGSYEQAAAAIRQLREQNSVIWDSDLALMQNLLATRIALKSGNIPNVDGLSVSIETDNFLAGEVYLVKGITQYQSGNMAEGMAHYWSAKKYFEKSGHKDKELMAWYNHLIGDTHVVTRSLQEQLQMFRAIEVEADQYAQKRILGLVHRQKSYFYKEEERYNAALLEAEKSIYFLELYGAASDYHLGLLNAAELCIELQIPAQAKKYFEMILPPIDKRVQFPIAFIESRLNNSEVNTSQIAQSCPHFLYRYELWKSKKVPKEQVSTDDLYWTDHEDSVEIQFKGKTLSLKKNMLEYKLIEMLAVGPHPKSLICEKLWPEYSDVQHLDNRLHRLISRMNKKSEGLITYSEKLYKLSSSQIIEANQNFVNFQ